jgi:hypothetical protein
MHHKRIGFIISITLLILLSACQMGTATPTSQPPVSVNCNQTGCPYPAICDLKSGVCTINQQQGPGAVAPQQPGAGIINNGQPPINSVAPTATETATAMPPTPPGAKSPGGVGPIAANPGNVGSVPQLAACNPPTPSVTNLNSYCSNGLGGASFSYQQTNGILKFNDVKGCDLSSNPSGCTGPQSSQVTVPLCTMCGASTQPLSNYVCATGYHQDTSGQCVVDSGKAEYFPCPPGSHYDNIKQACLDDSTSFVNPQCPGGFDFYLPDQHACLQNQNSQVYNCQSFAIQLGTCVVPACKQPVGGCGMNSNGTPKKWNKATCSCQ